MLTKFWCFGLDNPISSAPFMSHIGNCASFYIRQVLKKKTEILIIEFSQYWICNHTHIDGGLFSALVSHDKVSSSDLLRALQSSSSNDCLVPVGDGDVKPVRQKKKNQCAHQSRKLWIQILYPVGFYLEWCANIYLFSAFMVFLKNMSEWDFWVSCPFTFIQVIIFKSWEFDSASKVLF